MGSSFTNCQVRSNSAAAVRDALAGLVESRAYVSPPKNGWVTVYDEAAELQGDVICRIAGSLSRALKTAAFAILVHDSDIAAYWLYQGGALVDEFDSCPECLGRRVNAALRNRVRGKTDALLPLCLAGTTRAQIDAVIHPADGYPLMAEEIIGDLAKLLGIDDIRATLGFVYFDDEGEDILPDIADFEPIGSGADRKTASPQAAHGPADEPMDTFPLAIGMLTQLWDTKHEKNLATFASMTGESADKMLKTLRAGFDRGARDHLKRSTLPNRPTFDELKAARDDGPEALAELLARRTPEKLTEIGIGAALTGYDQFITALLKHGLNPNAKNPHGRTPLNAAEQAGKNSKIYQLLKAASDARG